MTPEAFDAQFRAQHQSALLQELWAGAWGDQYPAEVAPSSGCPWRLLGLMVAVLRPAPGSTLVDIGCGLGGPGLWLARATGARLVGVDWSETAVRIAGERSADWLSPGRARFSTGTFEATGLTTASADTVISVDALALAPDPHAALTEVRRVLRPGGRLLFTAAEPTAGLGPDGSSSWAELLRGAGLGPRARHELPGEGHAWGLLYASVREHRRELRAQMGGTATDTLLTEAAMVEPYLEQLSWGAVEAVAPD
ncbi:class I SAM-dependent methyltransferase [Nocardiopsis exhalans]|uniref:Class I SAM-dependent methyltransferase n=1 Tax=Nocardiopsis exhalans TaxID=163604 RepID=A0ABY5DGE0_9ACTN|nr:class I SAM-dependent methyltransferase [Nocardiopsis exhalans]USY23431.1 class I SAM-dependent methyltransferase [Nocardiopsis exhalans]